MTLPQVDPTSFLFVTLDSCRYDTFESANAPNVKSVGLLHRAQAPGYFTFASHAAMFVGFTPGVATSPEPYVNPKIAKIFRMAGTGFGGTQPHFVTLSGRNIIQGLKRLGYATIGTGAVNWFDPSIATTRPLTGDFDTYFFPGDTHSLARQVAFVERALDGAGGRPVLVFINVGETHVPYYHEGAPWSAGTNPCRPFGSDNDAEECWRRQVGCVEYVDGVLAPLLRRFAGANVVVCADHGDAWGEDGLWEHGIHHPKVLEVPLLFRLTRPPALPAPGKADGFVRRLWRRAGRRG